MISRFRNVTNAEQLARVVRVWDAARARVATYLSDLDNGKLLVLTIGAPLMQRWGCLKNGTAHAHRRVAPTLAFFPNCIVALCAGVGGAVVLSLLYCVLLQLLVAPLVWLTLLAANLGLIACTLLSFQKARVPLIIDCSTRWC